MYFKNQPDLDMFYIPVVELSLLLNSISYFKYTIICSEILFQIKEVPFYL